MRGCKETPRDPAEERVEKVLRKATEERFVSRSLKGPLKE